MVTTVENPAGKVASNSSRSAELTTSLNRRVTSFDGFDRDDNTISNDNELSYILCAHRS